MGSVVYSKASKMDDRSLLGAPVFALKSPGAQCTRQTAEPHKLRARTALRRSSSLVLQCPCTSATQRSASQQARSQDATCIGPPGLTSICVSLLVVSDIDPRSEVLPAATASEVPTLTRSCRPAHGTQANSCNISNAASVLTSLPGFGTTLKTTGKGACKDEYKLAKRAFRLRLVASRSTKNRSLGVNSARIRGNISSPSEAEAKKSTTARKSCRRNRRSSS
mmetsp:Transcript_8599/g.19159  ORF Transcript_8599/g.19159 Transcript_8599/m.19159 type:complete len:222 (+) Transcript_8599:1527-2192(+)